ncbi:LytTR family DNA-binding domain-containing protein [Qipengyuania marisflavi]|uniref:LytTR family transcriptional regulator n=1 Tax=Qipengyuania marisflavi TaxID=2486356 RepID=A0A5S3P1L9_9SPHN|nr:LytTR family DNA-binding domain-containing protein [Qipengyuania marisflavi]TMM46567.1 LytTR family transcriptional regulator [Qipengyuania marisflavi]
MSDLAPSPKARFARKLMIDLAIMLGVGLVLALIGPFGSFATPFGWRIVYWTGLAVAGYMLYQPIGTVILRLAPKLDLPEWFLWIVTVLVATVPMAILVWVSGQLPGPIRAPSLETALLHYFNVLIIGALITLMFNNLGTRAKPAPDTASEPAAPEAPAVTPAGPAFLDRLPRQLGSELIALEMEDHYVRAHTAVGSELILMRMRDAVSELDGLEGAQVHRSWWVARGAVQGVRRAGRNVRLALAGGLEAPVSRSAAPDLKAQGWW